MKVTCNGLMQGKTAKTLSGKWSEMARAQVRLSIPVLTQFIPRPQRRPCSVSYLLTKTHMIPSSNESTRKRNDFSEEASTLFVPSYSHIESWYGDMTPTVQKRTQISRRIDNNPKTNSVSSTSIPNDDIYDFTTIITLRVASDLICPLS